MINFDTVAEKIFSIIKGQTFDIVMFSDSGKETADPKEARRFFVKEPNFMITLDTENREIKINKNKNVKLDDLASLSKQLKNLANTFMLNSQLKIFGQEIKPKDFAFQAVQSKEKKGMDNVVEATFSKLHGSKKTSYQALESVKLVVRHGKPVAEEVRGSRSRAIKEIFIERAGERVKFPYNYLTGARAMARHVYEGGMFEDSVGQYIIARSGQALKLKEFHRYAVRNKLVNENSIDVIDAVKENINTIKADLSKLQGQKTYGAAKKRIEENSEVLIQEDETDELRDLFTVKTFDESIGEILPVINRLVQEKKAWKTKIEEQSNLPFVIYNRMELSEEDIMEFVSPQQKIGYRLNGVIKRVQEENELSQYVGSVAKKLIEGKELNIFETLIVRNVLKNIKIVESEDSDDEPSNFKDEWGRDTDEQDEWKKNVTGKKNKKVDKIEEITEGLSKKLAKLVDIRKILK